jgi:hypothetical protein
MIPWRKIGYGKTPTAAIAPAPVHLLPAGICKPAYLRFAEVRSTEIFAMNVAPHQLDPAPAGLLAVTLVIPVAV